MILLEYLIVSMAFPTPGFWDRLFILESGMALKAGWRGASGDSISGDKHSNINNFNMGTTTKVL
jgi:hypothetical protein